MNDTNKELAVQHRPVGIQPRWRMAPGSLGEAMEMATLISGSELCPKAYKNKPADCIVAYEYGASLGLSWMQALRHVAVINGVPSIFGDALPALIYGSGECERFHEYFEGEKGTDGYTAVCVMKRKGFPDEVKRTFSIADAKKANLWGKPGPWTQYSDRMQQFRARGFAARDTFADKLSGLILAEEAMDYPDPINVGSGQSEGAAGVTDPPKALTIFEALPEPVRDNIEKAFGVMNFAPGARLAKLTEYFGGDGIVPDDQATALLDWLKDEYAKRKTGQARAKKGDNGKKAEPKAADPIPMTTQSAATVVAKDDIKAAEPEAAKVAGAVTSEAEVQALF